jgi:hypothetical protein
MSNFPDESEAQSRDETGRGYLFLERLSFFGAVFLSLKLARYSKSDFEHPGDSPKNDTLKNYFFVSAWTVHAIFHYSMQHVYRIVSGTSLLFSAFGIEMCLSLTVPSVILM